MGIGFTEDLAHDAGYAIAGAEYAGEQAGAAAAVCEFPDRHDQQSQQHAFEEGLVELAGMARQRPAAREHHGPRHVADAAPQFAVDEVGEAAKEETGRRDDRHQVRQHEGIGLVADRKGQDRHDDAQQAAMERHAASPEGEGGQRVREVEARLVEQDVAQTSAQDDAQRRPQEKVVDLHRRQDLGRLLADTAHHPPTDHEACNIRQGVPADGEGPELDQNRVDLGIGNDERVHEGAPYSGRTSPSK